MKSTFTILIIVFSSINGVAQAELDSTNFENLVILSELHSQNLNHTGRKKDTLDALKTPELNHIIDAFLAVNKADRVLLTPDFLNRPSHQELMMWYVIREVHFNRIRENVEKKPPKVIASEVLEQEIDSRILLNNYYYMIQSGISKYFGDNNLKKLNLELDSFALKSNTEKAIFYLRLSETLVQRFRPLINLSSADRVLEFADQLPSFNGKPYYQYTNFDFEDFDYIPFDVTKSYKTQNLEALYKCLYAHLEAAIAKERIEEAKDLHENSILSQPKCFKYSGMKENLELLYTNFSEWTRTE